MVPTYSIDKPIYSLPFAADNAAISHSFQEVDRVYSRTGVKDDSPIVNSFTNGVEKVITSSFISTTSTSSINICLVVGSTEMESVSVVVVLLAMNVFDSTVVNTSDAGA